ncbi:MAG: hypothetical protein DMG32_04300 [Acidobacteria bacterium]|nr:MAG: hypothetical protein DMG32_04300 [Acidobacteriota bacterium]
MPHIATSTNIASCLPKATFPFPEWNSLPSALKDSEIFYALVFLARLIRNWTNGRPRARIYLQFLRRQFPQQNLQPETSRIIAP